MAKSLTETVQSEYPEFADEVLALNVEQLEKRIANYQKELADSEEHKANNEVLKSVKAQYDELKGPYEDVKKAVKLKTKYLVSLIREKGGM